jgi:hypothetical protein
VFILLSKRVTRSYCRVAGHDTSPVTVKMDYDLVLRPRVVWYISTKASDGVGYQQSFSPKEDYSFVAVGIEAPTAGTRKPNILWNMTPCSLEYLCQSFRGVGALQSFSPKQHYSFVAVGFEAPTAGTRKPVILRNVTPCSLVYSGQSFRRGCCPAKFQPKARLQFCGCWV